MMQKKYFKIGKRRKQFLILFLAFVISSMFLPRYDTDIIHLDKTFEGPSFEHVLGTDHMGRDLFSLILTGAKRTIAVVVISMSISLSLGLVFGLIAGYYEGILEVAVQFFTDLTLIVPTFIVALIVTALVGVNPVIIGVVIGVTSAGVYSNQVSELTKAVKKEDFILAAKTLGQKDIKIIFKHILPHVAKPVLTAFGNRAGSVTIQFASLSFIGLGTDLTEPDWGALLFQYRIFIIDHPFLIFWPSLAIFILSYGFQHLFDDYELGREKGDIYG